jgi:Arc/MetJ family transcription regulator
MSKRLQVVMGDAEYDEIQEAADAARLTVSAWVRQQLRDARAGRATPGSASTGDVALHPDPDLVRAVMDRHGLASPTEALDFALRRAADPPLSRSELLALRGAGWSGNLKALRGPGRAGPSEP